jgi:hypothetical protein
MKDNLLRAAVVVCLVLLVALCGATLSMHKQSAHDAAVFQNEVLAWQRESRLQPRWEYQVLGVVSAPTHVRTGPAAAEFSAITPDMDQLNELGRQGWELTGSYLEMETAWANFGNDRYVTGLQPNVRPQRLVLLFRRALPASTSPTTAPTTPRRPGS